MNKIVYFDMGNTLLFFHNKLSDDEKEEKGLIKAFNYIKKNNKLLKYEDFINDFYNKWSETFILRKIEKKEYSIEPYLNIYFNKYNITNISKIKIIELYYSFFKKHVETDRETKHILNYLKNKLYKIGIISNTYIYNDIMKSCFKKARIYKYIDYYFFSYSLKISKPNIEIFSKAIEESNANIKKSYMIGDNLNSDILPAQKIGLKTIWFNKNHINNNTAIKADFEINNLFELNNIIK